MMSVSEAGDARVQGQRVGPGSELTSGCSDGMEDPLPLHETCFQAAVKVIQSLPKNGSFQPSNEMMLKFYSFYKQATQGPCNVPRPGFWDPVGRYKWDAWSALGVMSKEEAMIAYVEEMKKILESMPISEKVEELLQVIGPFYEIVEDKRLSRGSGLTSVRLDKVTKSLEDLSSVLTSTPNCKAINGKAESSDSGAESENDDDNDDEGEEEDGAEEEEEVDHKEEEETQLHQKELIIEHNKAAEDGSEASLTNGYNNVNSIAPAFTNDTNTKATLNGINHENDIQQSIGSVESAALPDACTDKDTEKDLPEDISGMQHLTSDSDSEVFCDSMEQFGQEEPSDGSLSIQGTQLSRKLKKDHDQLTGNETFPENQIVALVDSGVESMMEVAIEAKGEVKDGGEDGKPSGRGPHKEKMGSERMGNYTPRRGRGSRLQAPGGGAQGWHSGSGGDDGEHGGSEREVKTNLNEQIAAVLMRLQEDMQNVLQRLHTLETLTASQARSVSLQSSEQTHSHPRRKPSWWPFEMSPGMLAFAFTWPFIAQWLVHVYLQRRRRKLH
ncbi:acyl-CoA-binding domain-containing protein 5 isoform X2 [Pleurodeles waltl]|uniref:acyl-CoA-binding domain-containing protein 5 isoform X2 n=1 Tax=Pleurodeles waltl TaxID=8319 RepID=UPI003709B2B8